jgi:hypothetical protein
MNHLSNAVRVTVTELLSGIIGSFLELARILCVVRAGSVQKSRREPRINIQAAPHVEQLAHYLQK